MSARLAVVDLGRRQYAEVLELQRALCRQRMAGERREDLLLLVEHEPVVTLGRGTRPTSLPLAPAELERRGYTVTEVERGGDVTYHGPGQLVGYPILDLREHREDLHWYLRQLEAALITALGALGVPAERSPGLTGVWTRGRKIASLGIHVKQWVTFHGFALNVSTDLGAFEAIVPCGITGVVMTSIAAERARDAAGGRDVGVGRDDAGGRVDTVCRADTWVSGGGEAAELWGEAREAVVAAFVRTFGYHGAERVTAEAHADAGAVIPSGARDLAREWLDGGREGS